MLPNVANYIPILGRSYLPCRINHTSLLQNPCLSCHCSFVNREVTQWHTRLDAGNVSRFCYPCHRCVLNLSPRWNKIPNRPLLLAPLATFLVLASSAEASLWHPSWSNVNSPKKKWMSKHARMFFKHAASSIRDLLKLSTKSQLSSIHWVHHVLQVPPAAAWQPALFRAPCDSAARLCFPWCFECFEMFWDMFSIVAFQNHSNLFKLVRRIRMFLFIASNYRSFDASKKKGLHRAASVLMLRLPHLRHPEAPFTIYSKLGIN